MRHGSPLQRNTNLPYKRSIGIEPSLSEKSHRSIEAGRTSRHRQLCHVQSQASSQRFNASKVLLHSRCMDGTKAGKAKASARTPSQGVEDQSSSKDEPRKRAHRVSRACDFCHSRSIRCRQSDSDNASCQSCIEYDRQCTYERPAKKRGVKSGAQANFAASSAVDGGTRDRESSVQGSASSSEPQLRLPSGITLNLVSALVQAYYEVVYPLYPIFHRQTLLDRLENSDHTHDRAFHCAVMSLCALTMTRVRDGAYYTNSGRISEEHFIHVPTFLESAASNMTRDPSGAENNDVLKSCLMLALTSLQENDIRNMKYYLGLYHSFVQIEGLTNERNWPQDLGRVETEERRRVFWSMYNLDLFCAACFESNMAWRESHILVNYPLEIYDEDLSDDLSDDAREGRPSEASSTPRGAPPQPRMPSWLVGWNFVTDLYRILEHAIDRRKRLMNPEQARTAQLFFPEAQSASQHSILRDIMTRYDRLPACFKEIRSVTFNMSSDCYVFQAANVAATIQLVRMTLFTTEMATTDQRCQIVSEVLQTFMEAPIGCLKAMSTPFFYHLSVIGTILVSAFRSPQCNASYGRVREVVLTLANLLANLEEHSQMAEPPSYRLRLQISRVDAYVRKEVAASRMAAIGGQTGGNLQFSETDSRRFADDGHHFSFPPELMEDWAWAFDFPQATPE